MSFPICETTSAEVGEAERGGGELTMVGEGDGLGLDAVVPGVQEDEAAQADGEDGDGLRDHCG